MADCLRVMCCLYQRYYGKDRTDNHEMSLNSIAKQINKFLILNSKHTTNPTPIYLFNIIYHIS